MPINQEVYQSFGSLQRQGRIKFRADTPLDVLKRIREMQIQRHSLDKLNMKLKLSDINKQKKHQNQSSSQDPLINYCLSFIFVEIEQMNLEELKFYKQSFESLDVKLLTMVGKVKMPNLQYLDLGNCQLASIQALTFLNLSGVKKLILKNNNLTSFRIFSKFYTPKLFWLQINHNNIKNVSGLDRTHMARRMALLQASQLNSSQQKDPINYLDWWMMKLPFDHINYIRKNEIYCVMGKFTDRKVSKKYPQLNFR